MPEAFVALIIDVVLVEILGVNLAPLCSCPCWEVNTIGYVAYVALLRIVALPDRSEHALAYPAVKLTYAVNLLACVASEGRHTEAL